MTRSLILLGLAGLLLAAGCRKDDLVACSPSSTSALENFTRRNEAPVQTFGVALGSGTSPQVITTSSGARIHLPPTSFLLPNGTVATGALQVRVREIYSVADMILSNMPTMRGGSNKLLISGGEFSIQAWQNGTRLQLAPGARVVVESLVPAGTTSGSQYLWQRPAIRLAGDSAGWIPPTPQPPQPGLPSPTDTIRTIGNPPVYQLPIPLDSVSWWNVAQLWQQYQTAPAGTVTMQFPAIPASSTGSTRIFLRPVGLAGLISPYIAPTQASWSGQLPTGASMVAAVLQSVDGQLYFGSQAFTTQNNVVIAPTLVPISEADAVQLIRQL